MTTTNGVSHPILEHPNTAAPAAGGIEGGGDTGAAALASRVPLIVLWITSLCVAIGILIAGAWRYNHFTANSFDLGIFQQAIWLIAHGDTPFVTVRGLHILGDHWTPILYPLALLSRLFPGPYFLIAVQSTVLPLGAIPLYRLAVRRTGSPWTALTLCGSYLGHPSLWGMAVFDFHTSSLAVTPLIAAVDGMDEDRPLKFVGWSLVALLCKEDIALAVILLSLLAALSRRWRWGWAAAAAAAAWLLLSLHEMAALSHSTSSSYWSLYGPTLGALHRGVGPFIAAVASRLCSPAGLGYMLVLLAPVGYLCLTAPELLAAAVPALLAGLLSERFIMQEIGFQYDVMPLAMVYVAAAVGAGRILSAVRQTGESESRARGMLCAVLILSGIMGVCLYTRPVVSRYYTRAVTLDVAQQREELLGLIPSNASVSAPNRVLPHLAARRRVYLFPNPAESSCWGSSAQALEQQMGLNFHPDPTDLFIKSLARRNVDYIVLSQSSQSTWPLHELQYRDLSASTLASPDYGVVAVGGGLVLLQRGAPHLPGLQQLGVPVSEESAVEQVKALILRSWRG